MSKTSSPDVQAQDSFEIDHYWQNVVHPDSMNDNHIVAFFISVNREDR